MPFPIGSPLEPNLALSLTVSEIFNVKCNASVDVTSIRPLNKGQGHSFWYIFLHLFTLRLHFRCLLAWEAKKLSSKRLFISLPLMDFTDLYFTRYSVATQLRSSGIFCNHFIILIIHRMCQWKNFENRSYIWRRYEQKQKFATYFWATLYVSWRSSKMFCVNFLKLRIDSVVRVVNAYLFHT